MDLMRNPVTYVIHTRGCNKGIRASAIRWTYGDLIADPEGLTKVTIGTITHLCHACLPDVTCKCKVCERKAENAEPDLH